MPDLSIERLHIQKGQLVCGIDEVGRGPMAGPVVAAAVILPDVHDSYGGLPPDVAVLIDDSKKLSLTRRLFLAEKIQQHAKASIGAASVDEVDRLNVLKAALLAMTRAVQGLSLAPAMALVDGNICPALACPAVPLVKGDQRSLSIAAASIVAKVYRDEVMTNLAKDYPHYGWDTNSGYCTAQHRKALRQFGPTPHHRQSFAPVAQLSLEQA